MSYVYISDLTPQTPPPSDAAKAQALEAQAADLKKTADALAPAQSAAASGLRAQADAMLAAAANFRKAAGLPDPNAWSTGTKVAVGVGAVALLGGLAMKFSQPKQPSLRFNRRR